MGIIFYVQLVGIFYGLVFMELFTGIFYGLVFVNCVRKYIYNIETLSCVFKRITARTWTLKEQLNCFSTNEFIFALLCAILFYYLMFEKKMTAQVSYLEGATHPYG